MWTLGDRCTMPRFKVKYPWLDVRANGVFCLYCSLRSRKEVSTKFISQPYTGSRVDLLTKHSCTIVHEESTVAFRESQVRASRGRRIEDVIEESETLTVEGGTFCDAVVCTSMYFLVKREIAHTTNFGPLRDLCMTLGNDTMPQLEKAKNATFRSEQSMHEIVSAIGSVLECDLLSEVKRSPYFSLIVDEFTDISVHKQLALSIQYLSLETASVKTRYLKLLDMSGPGKSPSVTGEVIAETVIRYLINNGLQLNKLAGASCDGAAVMLGKHQGAMVLIKQHVPELIVTYCSAHRLALASSDAAKSCTWFTRFERLLNQVYSYFSHSTVHTTQLAEMQVVLAFPQAKLQKPTETRWLSLENAVHALRCCFDAVQAVFEEGSNGDAMALGLAKHTSSAEFKSLLYFLSDVLSTLGALSVTFQSRNLNLVSVETIVNNCKSTLVSLKEDPFSGDYMMDLEANHPDVIDELGRECFQAKCKQYLSVLIDNIESRFQNLHLVSLLSLLDPRNTQSAKPDSIMELGEYFGVDGPKLWNEFVSYKSLVSDLDSKTLTKAVYEMWCPDAIDSMTIAFPMTSSLLARITVLPASSAEVERVFSSVKRIKTPLRNHLLSTTLDSLVRTTMDGPDLNDFDPIPVAKEWESKGKHRIIVSNSTATSSST